MASVMLDSVVNFSTKSDPQHLHLIRIAIFQPHMFEEFAETIDKKAQELQSEGYFDRMKGTSVVTLPSLNTAIWTKLCCDKVWSL